MEISIDSERLIAQFGAFDNIVASLRTELATVAFESATRIKNDAVANYRSAGATSSTATAVRSGLLRASYEAIPKDGTNGIFAEVGVTQASAKGRALEYAALQEFGGTIRPKNAKYLTIPLKDTKNKFGGGKTAAGVARSPSPRDFRSGFFLKRGTKLFFVQKDPKTDRLEFLFYLTKGPITIPARPALGPAAKAEAPILEREVADAIDRAIELAR